MLPVMFNKRHSMKSADHKYGLTQARLREVLSYNPLTGEFTWQHGTRKAGKMAGHAKNKGHGYGGVHVDGRVYLTHRLAWFYVYGEWPTLAIDHRNWQRNDNRIANLRDVSGSTNQENRRVQSNNKAGLLGAHWNKRLGKFMARIKVKNKYLNLGGFVTAEEAHQAYLKAKRAYHTGCTI